VVDEDGRDKVLATLLDTRIIECAKYLHTEFVGLGPVYLVAAVDLTGDDAASTIGVRLRRIADRIREQPYVQEAILTPSLPSDIALEPRNNAHRDHLE
jgi:hypothetical protein